MPDFAIENASKGICKAAKPNVAAALFWIKSLLELLIYQTLFGTVYGSR